MDRGARAGGRHDVCVGGLHVTSGLDEPSGLERQWADSASFYSLRGSAMAASAFAITASARSIAARNAWLFQVSTEWPSSNDSSVAPCARETNSRSAAMASASSLASAPFREDCVTSITPSHRNFGPPSSIVTNDDSCNCPLVIAVKRDSAAPSLALAGGHPDEGASTSRFQPRWRRSNRAIASGCAAICHVRGHRLACSDRTTSSLQRASPRTLERLCSGGPSTLESASCGAAPDVPHDAIPHVSSTSQRRPDAAASDRMCRTETVLTTIFALAETASPPRFKAYRPKGTTCLVLEIFRTHRWNDNALSESRAGFGRLRHDVSVRRLHIGQLVISAVSFQVRWRPVTGIRFTFETLQHVMMLKLLLLKDPRSRGQEFAEECDNSVLTYGRCLRPALYSSLRSSPSHPTGVSALRVTIAIASARKQWGLRKSTAKSRRLFRNESATVQHVRAGANGRSTAMTRTAFCRKSPRVPRVCWLGSWGLGTSDRENTRTRRAGRQDGEIKEARLSDRKPLTWLGSWRAGRSGRVPRRAFS